MRRTFPLFAPFALVSIPLAFASLPGCSGSSVSAAADAGAGDAFTPPVEAGPSDGSLDPPPGCTDAPPKLKLTPLVSGLTSPLLAVAPKSDPRLFIVEQGGKIRVWKDGALLPTPFLDVTSLLSSGGERGLLGLAFHPDFATNGRFFIHYSGAGDGRTVLAEYRRSDANGDVADGAAVKIVFEVPQPFANHNGGEIRFGPDGFLYMGLGDGGSGNDPQGNGQKLDTKLGKILRLDVDKYPEPPPGNMTGAGVDPQIWDTGLRNPWRFSFDRKTGDLYIGDVGQSAWEEIDFEPAGTGKQNYGWKVAEGLVCRPPTSGCDLTGFHPPVAVHPRSEAVSITGGFVYRGQAIPCLRGRYVYGDFGTGRVFSFVVRGDAAESKAELTSDLNPGATLSLSISSFGEDATGEMYLASYSAGRIYRIDAE